MKILFITHKFYPNVGGTEANAEFLASAFFDRGAEVHLLTWTKEEGAKQFPYKVLRDPSFSDIWREHRWADIVFENSPVLRLSWPVLFTRKSLVVSLNTWLTTEGQSASLQAKLKMQWLKKASAVIAVSNAIRKDSWPNAVVIENAYNDKLFVKRKDHDDRSGSFVYLGRLVSDKGVSLAIKAIADLTKRYSHNKQLPDQLKLTIIGDGPDLHKLQELVKALHVENRIRFFGSSGGETLVNELNEHKYMLVPSVWREPFGIVALEGLACGCVPIVADGGGLPDAVGNAGIVFDRGNVADLVNKIECILNGEVNLDELQAAAVAQLERHSPSNISQQYYEVLLSTLKRKR